MPLPVGWTLIPVVAAYVGRDGSVPVGQVAFDSAQIVVVDGVVVVPRRILATLNATGAISAELPSTNDPDISPGGWTYTVRELFEGGRPAYAIEVPFNAVSIDLATAIPVTPADQLPPYTDAPHDGTQYGRQDGGWVVFVSSGLALGAGPPDALTQVNAAGNTLSRTGYTIATLIAHAVARVNHTGTQLAATISDFALAVGLYITAHIAAVDPHGDRAFSVQRGNHTGTQLAATISDFNTTVDARLAAVDAMSFKGVIDCSANPNYPAADAGHTYVISVDGRVGGASGPSVKAGDMALCLVDASAAGNHATVGANWALLEMNLDGAVIGPASTTNEYFSVFDGTSGKLIKAFTAAQAKTALSLAKADVGLGNVDNTSDANKPVSTAQQTAINLKAPLASPAFTDTPTAPTAAAATNNQQIANTEFVQGLIADLIASSPGALDTLNELAAALGDDADFVGTMTTALATKLVKASNLADLTNADAALTNLGATTIGAQVFKAATAAAIRTLLELGTAATTAATAYATAAQGTTADAALARAGGTMSGAVNAADQNLQRPVLLDYGVTRQALGNVSGATTINLESGNAVTATTTGATTWTFSNPAPTGNLCAIFLRLTNGGSAAQTWPAAAKWQGGTAPTLTAAGIDELLFLTSDAGTVWRGFLCALDIK